MAESNPNSNKVMRQMEEPPAESATSLNTYYTDANHASKILTGLDEIRCSKDFCDITVKVNDREFPAHRNVLASFSSYFRAMFSSGMAESNQDVVTLADTDPDIFELLIDFCYTGKVKITKDNVFDLLAAGSFFDIVSVCDACLSHLSNSIDKMDAACCLDILQLSDQHVPVKLKDKAFTFAIKNFITISKLPSFDRLDVDILWRIISNDKLGVQKETAVFEVVKKWYEVSPETRREGFERLIEAIRFQFMPSSYLCQTVTQFMDEVNCPRLRDLVDEAKTYLLCPNALKNLEGKSPRMEPRSGVVGIAVLGGTIQFNLSQVSELGDHNASCPTFNIAGTRWIMELKRDKDRKGTDMDWVRIHLRYELDSDTDEIFEKSSKAKQVQVTIRLKRIKESTETPLYGGYGHVDEINKTYCFPNNPGGSGILIKEFCLYKKLIAERYGAYDQAKDTLSLVVTVIFL